MEKVFETRESKSSKKCSCGCRVRSGKIVILIAAFLVSLGVVIAVGLICMPLGPSETTNPETTKIVRVPVDWKKVPRMGVSILEDGNIFDELTLTTPLFLNSANLEYSSATERYATQMKLSFEGRGKTGEKEVRAYCEVVACPRIVPGDELALVFTNVTKSSCKTFDVVDGKQSDGSQPALEVAVTNALATFILPFDGVEGLPSEPLRIWVRSDGLECRVKEGGNE